MKKIINIIMLITILIGIYFFLSEKKSPNKLSDNVILNHQEKNNVIKSSDKSKKTDKKSLIQASAKSIANINSEIDISDAVKMIEWQIDKGYPLFI